MLPISFLTDYGHGDEFVGVCHGVMQRIAPGVTVIDLTHEVPRHDVRTGALALRNAIPYMPRGVQVAVVDPGVGGDRAALAVEADGRWYVGPDNGLFELVLRRSRSWRCRRIDWRPATGLSASFHGRDLFAPVAARLAQSDGPPPGPEAPPTRYADWPDDLPAVVYVDGYGNAMTGLRAAVLSAGATLDAGGGRPPLPRARTFSDLPDGAAFWYENANGLAEIAVNRGRAADLLGLRPGSPIAPVAVAGAGRADR